MKNTKGITLIALIVTIIVLIILAGISVNLLFGNNGILNKAKDSSEAQSIAEIKEKMGLDITAKQIENKGIVTKDDLEEILGAYGTVNYNEDETIKSVTTTEKGYEIALSDIYSGRIEDGPEPVVFTQGEKVRIGNEYFYVLTENDSKRNSTIELFAMYNLNKNPETEGTLAGHYMQLPNAIFTDTACRFSNTAYWSSETSYPFNLNTYSIPTTGNNAETLETNALLKANDYAKVVGGNKATGRLLTYEEAITIKNGSNDDLKDMLWGKGNKQGTTNNYYLSIWLGSANNSSTVWRLQASTENLASENITTIVSGVRPIITVSKSIVTTLNISYNKNDENASGTMNNSKGIVIANTYTAPSGKVFKEWNSKADGTGTKYEVGDKVTEDITLYAIWDLPGYAQCQKVKIGNEKFYVLTANDTATTETIELFAMYNLNNQVETSGTFAGHCIQLPNAENAYTGYRFSRFAYWRDETTYPVNLNTYMMPTTGDNAESVSSNALLKVDDYAKIIGGNSASGRLLTYEEALTIKNGSNADLKKVLWGKENQQGTYDNYYLKYWLGSACSTTNVFYVAGNNNGGISNEKFSNSINSVGIRAVITVPKNIVEVINE